MSEKKKVISVMIPTYNEEENARPIYEAVRDEIRKDCPDYDYEILFIDNKSQDRTRRIITDICAQDPKVKAIFNSKNFGQFNSPYYGMIHTTGDCTITICADFQDPVEMIPKFVAEWEKGYKIVIGKKTTSQENPVMYFLRDCYYKTIKKMSNVEMIEQFTGFGLYDKSFIQTLRDLHDPTPFLRGIVAEFFGFFCAAVSFILGLVFLVAKLIHWNTFAAGYAPMIIAVFFVGGVQLTFLGFLGEYIMAMNARIMDRPLVVEEKRLNFEPETPESDTTRAQ